MQYNRSNRRNDEVYRRPAAGQEQAYDDAPRYDEPAYDQPGYNEPVYDARPVHNAEPPYEEIPPYEAPEDAEPYEEFPPEPEVIATNGTVKLTSTLAAFCSLFALFLFFAERRSHAIRHFSVQSLGIAFVHLMGGAVLLLFGSLLGGIPFLGFLMTLLCWLLYIALLILCVLFRVRLMLAAYQGFRYTLPWLGEKIEHFAR